MAIFLLQDKYFSRELFLINGLLIFFAIPTSRYFLLEIIRTYRKQGYNYRRVIVVGSGPAARSMYDFITSGVVSGLRFKGFFVNEIQSDIPANLVEGKAADVIDYCLKEGIDEIYYALLIRRKNIPTCCKVLFPLPMSK